MGQEFDSKERKNQGLLLVTLFLSSLENKWAIFLFCRLVRKDSHKYIFPRLEIVRSDRHFTFLLVWEHRWMQICGPLGDRVYLILLFSWA